MAKVRKSVVYTTFVEVIIIFNFNAACLMYAGRAVFTCQHNNNCNRDLNVTEGGDITFDASVTFVEGGLRDQSLSRLILRKSNSSFFFTCDATEEDCQSCSQVEVEYSVQSKSINIRMTLRNVSLWNSGMYFVEIYTVTPETMDRNMLNQVMETVSLVYNVTVSARDGKLNSL